MAAPWFGPQTERAVRGVEGGEEEPVVMDGNGWVGGLGWVGVEWVEWREGRVYVRAKEGRRKACVVVAAARRRSMRVVFLQLVLRVGVHVSLLLLLLLQEASLLDRAAGRDAVPPFVLLLLEVISACCLP